MAEPMKLLGFIGRRLILKGQIRLIVLIFSSTDQKISCLIQTSYLDQFFRKRRNIWHNYCYTFNCKLLKLTVIMILTFPRAPRNRWVFDGIFRNFYSVLSFCFCLLFCLWLLCSCVCMNFVVLFCVYGWS
jgi:hypothetical protein